MRARILLYVYIFFLNKYYYIIILYGGSHASDILHVLMGVSVAKPIIYNIVLLFICHNKRSSSSSSNGDRGARADHQTCAFDHNVIFVKSFKIHLKLVCCPQSSN